MCEDIFSFSSLLNICIKRTKFPKDISLKCFFKDGFFEDLMNSFFFSLNSLTLNLTLSPSITAVSNTRPARGTCAARNLFHKL